MVNALADRRMRSALSSKAKPYSCLVSRFRPPNVSRQMTASAAIILPPDIFFRQFAFIRVSFVAHFFAPGPSDSFNSWPTFFALFCSDRLLTPFPPYRLPRPGFRASEGRAAPSPKRCFESALSPALISCRRREKSIAGKAPQLTAERLASATGLGSTSSCARQKPAVVLE
jgi:hypothetical protein